MNNKNNETTNAMFEKFSSMMVEELQHVQQEWSQPWFSRAAKGSPKNMNGRPYNGTNELFLWLLCAKNNYEFPIFATFNQISALNDRKRIKGDEFIHVIKGEHSFPVVYYKMLIKHKTTRRTIDLSTYNQLSEDERHEYDKYPMLRVMSVFNIAQTNMKEARPDLWKKLTLPYSNECIKERKMDIMEPVAKMIDEQSWICPIKEQEQDQAYYSINLDFVSVPTRNQFKKTGNFEGTLFHEMAHSTGRKDNLDRFNHEKGWGDRKAYAKEELIAELAAALTLGQRGITSHIKEDSLPYIKFWIDALHETSNFIKSVLSEVKKANKIINDHLEKYEEKTEEIKIEGEVA